MLLGILAGIGISALVHRHLVAKAEEERRIREQIAEHDRQIAELKAHVAAHK